MYVNLDNFNNIVSVFNHQVLELKNKPYLPHMGWNEIEIKKDWKEGIAKKELLELFSLLGNNNTITMEGRSRLSNLIFK